MHLHKIFMGSRWAELPAETVLDHKVSVAIGNIVLVQIVIIAGLSIVIAIQRDMLSDSKK